MNLLSPALILSLTLATLYGCGFHALAGRRIWQWPLFWSASLVGFFAGFAGGVAFGLEWLRVGSVPLLAATLGAALLVGIAWFFSAPLAADRRRNPTI